MSEGTYIPRAGKKSNGYQNYLFYKLLIDTVAKRDAGRIEIADAMGMTTQAVWHPLRVLKAAGVVKVVRYEVMKGSKREILGLVQK